MQGYDLVMIAVMLVAITRGYSKGLAWQISSIASIAVSYFVAYRFRDLIAPMIDIPDPWRGTVAMLVLFVGTSLVIWLLFQSVRGAIEKAKLKDFDQQLGAIFGGIKGAIWCTVLTLIALTVLGQSVSDHIVNSKSGGYIARFLANSKKLMPPEVQQVIQPYIEHAENKLLEREPISATIPQPTMTFPSEPSTTTPNLEVPIDEYWRSGSGN